MGCFYLYTFADVFNNSGHVNFFIHFKTKIMTRKEQLTSEVAGILLDYVRESRGRVTLISDATRINRKYFNVKGFERMKVHQMIRIVYALATVLTHEEFYHMMRQVHTCFEEYADEYDYDLLDE